MSIAYHQRWHLITEAERHWRRNNGLNGTEARTAFACSETNVEERNFSVKRNRFLKKGESNFSERRMVLRLCGKSLNVTDRLRHYRRNIFQEERNSEATRTSFTDGHLSNTKQTLCGFIRNVFLQWKANVIPKYTEPVFNLLSTYVKRYSDNDITVERSINCTFSFILFFNIHFHGMCVKRNVFLKLIGLSLFATLQYVTLFSLIHAFFVELNSVQDMSVDTLMTYFML